MMTDSSPLSRIVDALDIETCIVCGSKEEASRLGIQLLKDLGFKDVDVVFAGYANGSARIRLRANIYRPGDLYGWCSGYGEEAR